MTSASKPPRYYTFLLTFWEERNHDPKSSSVWPFRLEDPRTGQKRGFVSLEHMITALNEEMWSEDGNDLAENGETL